MPIRRDQSIRITKDGHPAIRREVDGEIQVWNLATGRKLPPLRHTPSRGVLGVTLSSDGNKLAAVEERVDEKSNRTKNVLTLWDVRVRTARDLAEGRTVPGFAPDGKTLAVSFMDSESKRSELALWDARSGKRRTVLYTGANYYYGVPIFSPDGAHVAASVTTPNGPLEVKLWEVATGKEVGSFVAPENSLDFNPLAFSPTGRRLAAVTWRGDKVFLYDIQSRKLVRVWNVGKNTELRDPVFSPDGGWLAVPGQEHPEGVRDITHEDPLNMPQPRVFLFDLAAGSEPEVVIAPHGFVGRARFSPDGRTMALGGDGCVWLFNAAAVRE
jgi:WD40 repeat protein